MKKKIIILTSSGGGGHLAASSALEEYLRDEYTVSSVHVFQELLLSLDIFRLITFKQYSGEALYNNFIKQKYFRFLAYFSIFGAWYIYLQKNRIASILRSYFTQESPDLIISVIPYINYIVLEVSQELNIPFLLIPTDMDITTYCKHIKPSLYKQFYIGLAFDDQQINNRLQKIQLNDTIFTIGAPLKISFFEKKNKNELRQKYEIAQDRFTIMVLMGAQGCNSTKKYIEQLLNIHYPIHIIACVGKNTYMNEYLNKISIPSHLSISIIGFTNSIADYMAMADIIISKSGSLSLWEAIYSDLPLLLDATSFILPWERFNHSFVVKHNIGLSIQKHEVIVLIVTALIQNPLQIEEYRNNLEKLDKKNSLEQTKQLIEKIYSSNY